jgi:hypothetical protein
LREAFFATSSSKRLSTVSAGGWILFLIPSIAASIRSVSTRYVLQRGSGERS